MTRFCTMSERVNAADLLGPGFTIRDVYWQAEMRLPDVYDSDNFMLRELWQSDCFVSWPEADMLLNQDPGVIPVGWRALSHLYYNQEDIPVAWLEVLTGGRDILFPYAICDWINDKSSVACASLSFNKRERTLGCQGVHRWLTGATLPIAVYRIDAPPI